MPDNNQSLQGPGQTEEEFTQSLGSPGQTESEFASSIDKAQQPPADAYKGYLADHFFSPGRTAGDLLSAYGQGVSESWGAAPIQNLLKDIDKKSPDDTGITSTIKGWNETFLRPAAWLADAAVSTYIGGPMGVLDAAGQRLEGTATDLEKQGPVGKFLAPVPGGVGEILSSVVPGEAYPGHPEYGYQGFLPEGLSPHSPHDPVSTANHARSMGATAEGEEGFFGTRPVSDEAMAARRAAAEKAGVPVTEPPEAPLTDLHEVMSKVAPDLMAEYQAKVEYQDPLTKRLEELGNQQGSGTLLGEDSPELQQAKEAWKDNYNRLQELSPDVEAAYEHAHSIMMSPEEIAAEAAKKPQEAEETAPVGGTEERESPADAALKGSYEEDKGKIAEHQASALKAAGVPEDQALAAGALLESHYNARAARFGGKLGTGLDLYHADAPEVRRVTAEEAAQKARGNDRTLNQSAQPGRLRVARKMPDGTVKIGQPGELHADLISDEELDRQAVGHVGMEESDMGFATPDGKFLTREEAKKWAIENHKGINPDIINGGPRDKDKLESTGYESELRKADLKSRAETELPPHLQDDEPYTPEQVAQNSRGRVFGKSSLPSDYRVSGPGVVEEGRREIEQITAAATKAFHDEYYGPDRFKPMSDIDRDAGGDRAYNQDLRDYGFYSALERGVGKLSLKSGTPEQWSKTVDNLSGVKKEEVEWSGLKEWLADQKGSVSKGAVQKFLDDNNVRVQEVNKGERLSPADTTKLLNLKDTRNALLTPINDMIERHGNFGFDYPSQARSSLADNPQSWDYDIPEDKELALRYSEAQHAVDKAIDDTAKGGTKYESHRLPGGQDYHEILLTLPEKDQPRLPEGWTVHENKIQSDDPLKQISFYSHEVHDEQGDQRGFGQSEEEAIKDAWSGNPPGRKNFQSSHWDESNVLSHIRFDDRVGPDGEKILHVAEVQSDWHQHGRKMGYESREGFKEASDEDLSRGTHEAGQRWGFIDRRTGAHEVGFGETEEEARQSALRTVNSDIRRRIAEGKGLVPGAPFKNSWQELSMKRMLRYAAENGYDRLSWDTGETNAVRANQALEDIQEISWHPETKNLMVVDKKGDHYVLGQVPEEKLSDHIGKDATVDLLKSSLDDGGKHVLQTKDLTVGGKGNRKFYDEILPQFMDKYTKKWGGKVEDSQIVHKGTEWEPADNTGMIESAKSVDKTDKVHSVDITPEMKKSVLGEGQSLFQGETKGSISVVRNGRNIIRLFEKADASTFFHETGHQWLEELFGDAAHPDAPKELLDDVQTVRDYLDMKPEQTVPTRGQHELFARSFERYLREGVSPTKELDGVFAKLKQWLMDVYKTLRDLGKAPLNPDLREVFDKLVAHEGNKESVLPERQPAPTLEPEAGPEYSQRARDVGRKRGARLPDIKGTGETKVKGLAGRLEADAVERELVENLGDLPTYQTRSYKTMAGQAVLLASRDPEKAFRIAMGEDRAPVSTTPEAVFIAVKNNALRAQDVPQIMKLKDSRLISDINNMAVRLGSLRDPENIAGADPVRLIRELEQSRNQAQAKKGVKDPLTRAKLSAVTPEQARNLIAKSKDVRDKYRIMEGNNDPDAVMDKRIAYGRSLNDLIDYYDSLKPDSRTLVDHIANIWNVPKSLQTSILHFSAPGVQGWGMLSRKQAYTGIVEMFKYFHDEENYQNLRAYMVSHPDYKYAKVGRLGLTDVGDKLSAREEAIQSSLVEDANTWLSDKTGLPNLVRASGRAFTGYLNYVRFNTFVDILNSAKAYGENLDLETELGKKTVRELAKSINDFTGRGDIGIDDKHRNVASALSMIFYSPRKVAATVNMFNPLEYMKPDLSHTARIARIRQITGSLGITFAFLSFMSYLGYKVNWDPLSTGFGTVDINGAPIDPSGGNSTYVKLMSQLIANKVVTSSGKTRVLGPDQDGRYPITRKDLIERFLRGKLSPTASIFADSPLVYGQDPMEHDFDAIREAKEKMIPLVASENIQYWHDHPADASALLPLMVSMMGIPMRTPAPPQSKMGLSTWGVPTAEWDDPHKTQLDDEFKKAGLTPSFPGNTIDGVKLTPDQYHDYIALSGGMSKELLDRLIQKDSFQKAPVATKQFLLKGVVGVARTTAQATIAAHNPELMREIVRKGSPVGDPSPQANPIPEVPQDRQVGAPE